MPHLTPYEHAYLIAAVCAFAVFIVTLGGVSTAIMLGGGSSPPKA